MRNDAFESFSRRDLVEAPTKIANSLREFGVVYITGFEEDIFNARDEFNNCFKDESSVVNRHSKNQVRDDLPKISRLLFSSEFDDVRNKYLGYFNRKNVEIFTQTTMPTVNPLSGELHFDRRQTFKVWIYFNDVNVENGPMRVVPHSILGETGTKNLRKSFGLKELFDRKANVHRPPSELKSKIEQKAEFVTGAAGTLFLHDTDAWHGASIVQPGNKRMIARSHHRSFIDNFIR